MTQFETQFSECPRLGVGLGLRRPLLEETLNAIELIDFLEIVPENFMGRGGMARHVLERAKSVYPLVSHGVSLSLGSVDPWDHEYIHQLKALFDVAQPAWFSDHLSYSGINGAYFNDLIPLPRTEEAVDHVVERIRYVQKTINRLFLIENISFYGEYPQNKLSEAQFLTQILEKADCGLLLDVNNVYVNGTNQSWDPYEFLSQIPLERVVQIHVAGHTQYPEAIIDTHGDAVCEPVWDLLAWVMERCQPAGVLLERDLNLPPFQELEIELRRIKALWQKTQQAVQSISEVAEPFYAAS